MPTPRELQKFYMQGKNITSIMRGEQNLQHNTEAIIELAYDLQSGSYLAALDKESTRDHKKAYTTEIAKTILSLCNPLSILEAGVGEATTLSGVLQSLNTSAKFYGFDLSWSRIAYARRWLNSNGISDVTLCTGSLLQIPFADNSMDLVYTSHSIEPNGGNEKPILEELYRITRKYLVLLEPGYELASPEARHRMNHYGYCKGLVEISKSLGFSVLKHDFFRYTANPLNPTAITIIKKDSESRSTYTLACPKYKTPLEEIGSVMFSPEALVVYPIIDGIPCLRTENGVLASHFKEFTEN